MVKLSKTTVKSMIDHLTALRFVTSAGKGLSTEDGGKKPELYRFNQSYGYIISIHVTPDSILAATSDLLGNLTNFSKNPVREERHLPTILSLLVDIVRGFMEAKAQSGENLIAIVVALPGLADSSKGNLIYSPHFPSWGRDIPFIRLLLQGLGPGFEVPVFIDCVNRYQAIAERHVGMARHATNFIIIDALNEGLGSGIVLHGELLRGSQSLSGEIGHMTVDPVNGPVCICGNRGCFEAMISAKRIRDLAREARQRGVVSALFSRQPIEDLGLETVCACAAAGDAFCDQLLGDVARWFVVGLGNIIMVNDPELIIIQGEYVKAGERFLDRIREGIRSIGLPDVEKRVRIEYSSFGEERGVLGGAAFALENFFQKRIAF